MSTITDKPSSPAKTATRYAFMFRPPSGGRWVRISTHDTPEAAWMAALEYPHSGDIRCDVLQVPAGPDLFDEGNASG